MKEKTVLKKKGDFMYRNDALKVVVSSYISVGKDVAQGVAISLMNEHIEVTKELLEACFNIKTDDRGYPVCPLIQSIIEKKLKETSPALKDMMEQRASRMLVDIAKRIDRFEERHPDKSYLKYLLDMIEIQDGEVVVLADDYKERINQLCNVSFESEQAADIANQHEHVAEELNKLYSMINGMKRRQIEPSDLFIIDIDGKVLTADADYNTLV